MDLMKGILLRKLGTAALTSLIFPTLICLVYLSSIDEFITTFLLILMFGTLAIFVLGVPCSLLIDWSVIKIKSNNMLVKSSVSFIIHIIAGYVSAFIYLGIIFVNLGTEQVMESRFQLAILGIFVAILFWMVERILKEVAKSIRAFKYEKSEGAS